MLVAAVAVTGTLTTVLLPGAAYAAEGSLSSGGSVLYSGCWEHPYTYSLPGAESADGWSIDATLYGPDGIEVASDYEYGEGAPQAAATSTLQICSEELPGKYTITATATWYDTDSNRYLIPMTPATFTMRDPFTRTGVSVSTTNPRYGQPLSIAVSSKDERPNGFFANGYATVTVQRYTRGQWIALSGGRLHTNTYGRASDRWRFNSRVPMKLRAVTSATTAFGRSVSRVITVR
jgi:hypothetical protein